MKMTYKNLLYAASGALLCLFLAFPASAQRPASGGGSSGGGGGTKSSGSSGGGGGSVVSSARPSGGGSVGVSRPSMGNAGVSRPSGGVQRTGAAPQRYSGQGYSNRQGVGYAPRQGVVYAPRQGAVAGNYGYPARTGVPSAGSYTTAYRTAPQIGYGRGGYWGNHSYYYHNTGYYSSHYLPNLGYTCGYLPFGYYPFFWGDYQYFYSNGLFYQYENSEYTVVEPPIGAEIATLSDKAQSIVINGVQYYEEDGVYYMPVKKDDGTVVYEVVGKDGELNTKGATVRDEQPQGPQMGDIVSQLPPDCRKIKVSGQKLWVSPDGIYYQEQVDASGAKTYKIVGLPSDEPQQN
jgi:hypothetical protein